MQASSFEVNREVNNGRGPLDFKVSRSRDSTLLEIKLASNSQLKRNLEHQVEIYKKATEANLAIKMIICYSEDEQLKVARILRSLELTDDPSTIVIDARSDNKPSGSRA